MIKNTKADSPWNRHDCASHHPTSDTIARHITRQASLRQWAVGTLRIAVTSISRCIIWLVMAWIRSYS